MYTVSVTNHKSLLAEHGIKSLIDMIKYLMLHATGPWINYVDDARACYNNFSSPNLNGLCPHKLVFGNKPKILPDLEIKLNVPIVGTYKQYLTKLQSELQFLKKHLEAFCGKRFEMINKEKEYHEFQIGELVYLHLPSAAIMQTRSRKICCKFVGPLVIYKAVSPNQFLIMSLRGEVYPKLIEETRLKPGVIRTTKGNVRTLAALKSVLRSGYSVKLSVHK